MLAKALNKVLEIDSDSSGKINMLTHSYGGVVARYMLYNEPDTRTKIQNLLMLGPPHHGSYASYRISHFMDYLSSGRLRELLPILQRVGILSKSYLDPAAPIYRELTPGSANLMLMTEEGGNMFSDGENSTINTLIIAGNGRLVTGELFHDEAPNHDDGVVSISSASLLNFGIDLGIVDLDHEELRQDQVIISIVKDFFYDDSAGQSNGVLVKMSMC